jgi:polyisoprenoid-binding protein YceI
MMPTDQPVHTVPGLVPGTYRLVPEATTVRFSARKLGLFTIRGSVMLTSGSFTVADPLGGSTVHAVLAAASFRTPMDKRDEHVKGEKLLDVEHYPTMEFTGSGVSHGPDGWSVPGTLVVHGQSRPLALAVQELSQDDASIRIRALAQVDRNDFGVTGVRLAAGPKVDVVIDAVAARLDAP